MYWKDATNPHYKDKAIYGYDGPNKSDVCCANCEDAKMVNRQVWCDLHDHPIMRPDKYRCKDFTPEEANDTV